MHKIQLEESCKLTIERHRHLNPSMKEVVIKEIIKWIDVEVVYPIFDSKWVSPVQCMPKKGGMAVVANERNELIPNLLLGGGYVWTTENSTFER